MYLFYDKRYLFFGRIMIISETVGNIINENNSELIYNQKI